MSIIALFYKMYSSNICKKNRKKGFAVFENRKRFPKMLSNDGHRDS